MKKRTFSSSIIICITLLTTAQVPQKFNYQAVVRNSQNAVLANQSVGFKMSLLKASPGGEVIYAESHNIMTGAAGQADFIIGEGSVISGSFEDIQWGDNSWFLKVEVDVAGGTTYEHLGTVQLISVPYALYSGNVSSPTRKFTIQEEAGHVSDSALFEVKNKEGQTVFAVYPEGTRVYVPDEAAKSVRGGFAVGGYSRNTKGITQEYMRVTPDSIRMYFPEETTKSVKGGFAVGGYSRNTKGNSEYLNISGQNVPEIIPGVNRVVWYPHRNAFMVGNVLVESADSVGRNSMAAGYRSKAIGDFSQAFGHHSVARGDYSTAIGREATANAINSVSIGRRSQAADTSSFALGTGAIALGVNSYAIGSAGVDSAGIPTGKTTSIGEQSFAFGVGAQAEGFGSFSIGTKCKTFGDFTTAIGYQSEAYQPYSIAIGKYARAGGWSSMALGRSTTAGGNTSIAIGRGTTADGPISTAMGDNSTAGGLASTAMGYWTKAIGKGATSMGKLTFARGDNSTALGHRSIASGDNSTSLGTYTTARSYSSTAIGRFNDTIAASSRVKWAGQDPLFTIGNGSSDSTRHNAMRVLKNGELYLPDVYGDVVGGNFRDLHIDDSGKIGYVSSSRRYKSNITSMDDVGWLYNLRPVNFQYKEDESRAMRYGLIAEEVEEVNPLFVSYNDRGEVETVSYSQLVTPLLKAVQEQNEMIQALQVEIERLKALIE